MLLPIIDKLQRTLREQANFCFALFFVFFSNRAFGAETEDLASLDRLNDIELASPISWWPLAPGWYVIAAGVLLVLSTFILRAVARWKANAYRRAACAEWSLIVATRDRSDSRSIIEAMSNLLKRVALTVAPREQVASLSGDDWIDWLNKHGCGTIADNDLAVVLTENVYRSDSSQQVSGDQLTRLTNYVKKWIVTHQIDPTKDNLF